MQERQTIHLGELSKHLGRAFAHLVETVFAPLGLFYLLFTLTNLTGALLGAMAWALCAIGWRLVKGIPIPMVLVLTTGLLLARTVIGFVTGSVFLYFLQPTLQNYEVQAIVGKTQTRETVI
jgi:hypothetical protein